MVAKRGGDALAASASCPPQKFPRRRAFPAIKSFKQPCGLSSRLMDKKVSVSQFLQQARRTPGAKPPPLPRQPPPPPPRPRWPSSGRVSAALLLGLGLFGLVAFVVAGEPDRTPPTLPAAPPTKQPPAVTWSDTPPSRNTDLCENYVAEGQRAAAKKLIGLHGYECRTIDQMCPYIMSEGFSVYCNDFRYVFELENHGGIWSVKAH